MWSLRLQQAKDRFGGWELLVGLLATFTRKCFHSKLTAVIFLGAQRVMVAQKAEPKPAPAPTVPVLDARIPTLPHAAPVSSDAPAPAPAPAPGPEPVVSKPVTRSAAAIASSHVSDRAGARSAIPILSDVSSKVTTRSAAAMDEPDLHLPPPKLTVASFKAPLWNTRLAAFETLQRSLAEPATSELDFAPSKIAEILSLGLDDTHVKIASCAMQSLKPFIEKHPAESRYLELFLGRVLSAAKSSSSTSRQPTTSVASDILEMFKKSCDPEALLHSSLNVLTASDWAKVSRVKLGALDLVGGVLAENAMIAGRSSSEFDLTSCAFDEMEANFLSFSHANSRHQAHGLHLGH